MKIEKKLIFLIIFYLILFFDVSYSQMQQDWARRYRGPLPYGDAGAGSVCVDDSGNVYVTGAVNIASGAKCTSIKYNKYGDSLWVRDYQRPGYNYNYGNDILLDDSGNVLVAGAESVLKYDRNGNLLWTAYNSADYTKIALGLDGFIYAAGIGSGRYVVSKYDRNGNLYWRSSIIGAYKLKDVEIDKDGNILILGYSLYYITDYDYRTIKFAPNGSVIWDIHYNGTGPPPANDNPYALTTDNEANVYVTGASQDPSGIHNCTTVKYDSSGNVIWVKRIHPPNNGYDIKVDESQNVYIAARSSGFNYTFKLDINGNIMWTRTYPTNDVWGINQSVLILDSINNVYVTVNVDSNNSTRYGAIKYDNNGNQIFIVNYHYVNIEFNYVYDMVLDKNGSVYLTGQSNTSYATVKYSPTIISGINENILTPDKYVLHQNYPNPFNPTTQIKFDLPKDVLVSIKIFDILGREVRTLVNDYKTAGRYTISFNGADLSSGIYYYKIKAGDFEQVRKMMLIK